MAEETIFKGTIDQPTTNDGLKIDEHISGLSSFLTECNTPMTIAIQGDWGSGKSSLMKMVEDKLDKSKVHCIWFNTWQFSQFNGSGNLSISLIKTLISELASDKDETKRKVLDALNTVGSFMLAAVKGVAYGVFDDYIGSTNTGSIKKAADAISFTNETISKLKANFEECVENAVKERAIERIVIFIDDLDRLEPVRAVELLEVMKIFLDCKKCVFVLALDSDVVFRGVNKKYNEEYDEDKGASFFDKIIQIPYRMPVEKYEISTFVKENFIDAARIEYSDEGLATYVALIESSIGHNPRSMKRLFNSYVLLSKVESITLQESDSIGSIALFAVLCMQLHFKDLYNYFLDNKVSHDFFLEEEVHDDIKPLWESRDDKSKRDFEEFLKTFKAIVTQDTKDILTIEKNWKIIMDIMGCAGIVSTVPTVTVGEKKRVTNTFIYKNNQYGGRGYGKKLLGELALQMIHDYKPKNEMAAEELMKKINTIPCYDDLMRKHKLGMLIMRTDPRLEDEALQNLSYNMYYTGADEIVVFNGTELLVTTSWNAERIKMLKSILGYDDDTVKLVVS